jgi:hypothetical protein
MSQSAPDRRGSLRGGRRYAILISVAVLAGLIAGPATAAFSPGTVTSTALVALQASGGCHRSTAAIEDSSPLASAGVSLSMFGLVSHVQVQVQSVTPSLVSVSATAGTAAQAEAAANAAANNYIAVADPASSPAGPVTALLLQPATSATGTAGPAQLLDGVVLGLVSGLLAGVAAALVGRRFSTPR